MPKHQTLIKTGKIFKWIKENNKHISNRNFQLKMIPLEAECFNLFKYMCFCPTKVFCGLTGSHKVRSRDSRLKIEAKKSRNCIYHGPLSYFV